MNLVIKWLRKVTVLSVMWQISMWLNVHDNDLEVISTNFRLVGIISGNLTGHEFYQMRISCIKELYFLEFTSTYIIVRLMCLTNLIGYNCMIYINRASFEVCRYRLMYHKLTVSHSPSGNEFFIAISRILSKQ